jgi:septal ring factor EnvC (AmiA/AmiB activator)
MQLKSTVNGWLKSIVLLAVATILGVLGYLITSVHSSDVERIKNNKKEINICANQIGKNHTEIQILKKEIKLNFDNVDRQLNDIDKQLKKQNDVSIEILKEIKKSK